MTIKKGFGVIVCGIKIYKVFMCSLLFLVSNISAVRSQGALKISETSRREGSPYKKQHVVSAQKRGRILVLDAKITQLKDMLEGRIGDVSGLVIKKCIEECKKLSQECGLDTAGVDWGALLDNCSQVRTRACPEGCPGGLTDLANKISMILTKLCNIELILPSGNCGTPITDAMLPLTIASGTDDGKKYFFAEPLTHMSAATPALTITARGVTIDMAGFALTASGLSTEAIAISGDQCTIMNGTVYVTASTAPAATVMSIAATAEQAHLKNLGLRIDSWTAGGVISYAGEQTILQDVSILVDGGAGGIGLLGNGGSEIDVDGFNLVALGSSDGTGMVIDGNATIKNSVIRIGTGAGASIGISLVVPGIKVVVDSALLVSAGSPFSGVVAAFAPLDAYVMKNIAMHGVTGIGIRIGNPASSGVISDCQVTAASEGVGVGFHTGGSRTVLEENRAIDFLIGFLLVDVQFVARNNGTINCPYVGFYVAGQNGLVYNNTSVGSSAASTGFLFSLESFQCVGQRNNATGHAVGFADVAIGPVNYFATNYAAANTMPYDLSSGFFAAIPPVAVAASTSYWDNVIA